MLSILFHCIYIFQYLSTGVYNNPHNEHVLCSCLTYNIQSIVNTDQKPNDNDYDILIGAEKFKYRKAEFVIDQWVVVEDAIAKSDAEQLETDKVDRQTEFRNLNQYMTNFDNAVANIGSASTMAQLKTALGQYTTVQRSMMRRIIRELTR